MHIKTSNTILYCTHWQKTVTFYKQQLELAITASNDWFVEFELNEQARLSVANEKRASIKSSHGAGITITLEVDDINATQRYLINRNLGPATIKSHAWGAYVIHIFDPEGNRLEFWSTKQDKDKVNDTN